MVSKLLLSKFSIIRQVVFWQPHLYSNGAFITIYCVIFKTFPKYKNVNDFLCRHFQSFLNTADTQVQSIKLIGVLSWEQFIQLR